MCFLPKNSFFDLHMKNDNNLLAHFFNHENQLSFYFTHKSFSLVPQMKLSSHLNISFFFFLVGFTHEHFLFVVIIHCLYVNSLEFILYFSSFFYRKNFFILT